MFVQQHCNKKLGAPSGQFGAYCVCEHIIHLPRIVVFIVYISLTLALASYATTELLSSYLKNSLPTHICVWNALEYPLTFNSQTPTIISIYPRFSPPDLVKRPSDISPWPFEWRKATPVCQEPPRSEFTANNNWPFEWPPVEGVFLGVVDIKGARREEFFLPSPT